VKLKICSEDRGVVLFLGLKKADNVIGAIDFHGTNKRVDSLLNLLKQWSGDDEVRLSQRKETFYSDANRF